MGQRFITLILILLLHVSIPASAYTEDPEPGWSSTSITTQTLLYFMRELFPCHQTERNYLACIHMINGLGESSSDQIALIPTALKEHFPAAKYEVLTDLGALQFVRVLRRPQPSKTLREVMGRIQLKNKLLQEAVATNWASGRLIDVEALAMTFLDHKDDTLSDQWAIGNAINSLLKVHDGHARIEPVKAYREAIADADQKYSGIGVVLDPNSDDEFRVRSVIDGSPAERAGLRRADRLVAINYESIKDLAPSEVSKRLLGPDGSSIILQIIRDGQLSEPLELIRRPLEIPNLRFKIVQDLGHKMAHLQINTFMDQALCRNLKTALQNLDADVEGLILDVRGNYGGLVDEAVCVGGLFVGRKTIYIDRALEEGGKLGPKNLAISTEDQVTQLPMVVLVNESSMSASELIAGALQDHERAFLVGERTFGKGTAQEGGTMTHFPDIYYWTTIARFYEPLDHTHQIVGLEPDFTIPFQPNERFGDHFVLRESDALSALAPEEAPVWQRPRQELSQQMLERLQTDLRADRVYLENDKLDDYQVLKAQEILSLQIEATARTSMGCERFLITD